MIEQTASLLLMVGAALGSGTWVLLGTQTLNMLSTRERIVVAFVFGIGVIGWLLFFAALTGHTANWKILTLFGVLSTGVVFLRQPAPAAVPRREWPRVGLLAFLAMVLAFDLAEGIAPPTDADSLTYHFALPKSFLLAGHLTPSFQAVEGAVPLLQQMTYMGALGTGGELTMTLWAMVTGWAAGALIYVISRRFLSINVSLAVALVFMTTPAVIYGAGSGQVEVRNAAFALVAALAATESRRTGLVRFAVLAGIAAGFFMASKYTGLIFGFACGCMVILQRRWLSTGFGYTAALIVVGSQWYGWNVWNIGDPVFPVLYGILPYLDPSYWNESLNVLYRASLGERIVPTDPLWFFGYPIMATLFTDFRLESLRVGFGPYILLLVPFVAVGIWRFRQRLFTHPLFAFCGICLIAYTIWFFAGQSQRIRHLLPIYPLLLIGFSVLAMRAAESAPTLWPPLKAILFLTLSIQLAGAALFALKFISYATTNESREAFLQRNVSQFGAVKETQELVPPNAHLLVTTRQLVYHFDRQVFYANPSFMALIEVHPGIHDANRLWRQLRNHKITHVLVPVGDKTIKQATGFPAMVAALRDAKCVNVQKTIQAQKIASRTLPTLDRNTSFFLVAHLTPVSCQISR